MRISDWSSDVCSSDLAARQCPQAGPARNEACRTDPPETPAREGRRKRLIAVSSLYALPSCAQPFWFGPPPPARHDWFVPVSPRPLLSSFPLGTGRDWLPSTWYVAGTNSGCARDWKGA